MNIFQTNACLNCMLAFLTEHCSPLTKRSSCGWTFFLVLISVGLWKKKQRRNNRSKKCGFQIGGLKKSLSFPTHNDLSFSLSKRENRSSREGAEWRKLNALAIILSLGYATKVLGCLSIYPSPAKSLWHFGFILMW